MTEDLDTFVRMAREFPFRTALFSFALPAFGLVQLVGEFVREGPVAIVVAVALLSIAVSVLLTRYQIAVYRRQQVVGRASEPS